MFLMLTLNTKPTKIFEFIENTFKFTKTLGSAKKYKLNILKFY